MALLDRLKALFPQPDTRRRQPLELETAALRAAADPAPAGALTDADGRPVDTSVLDQEQAGPTMGGVRSILANAVTGTLDPYKLKRILNAAVQGDADEYLQLAEEMEEGYPHYRGQLRTRKLAVCGLDITVDAASDDTSHVDDAQLIRDFLGRDTVDAETFDMQDSAGKGFSVTELLWDKSRKPWLPRLKTRSPQWFEFDRIDGETLRLKGGPDGMSATATDLEPYKYIVHRQSDKTGQTIRGGLARVCCWAYLFHGMSLKDWVICAEVYGMPIRVGKYDRNATADDRRKLLQAVMNIAADAAAIIPDSMMIEFVNAMAGVTPDIYKSLLEYLDQSVSKAVLGQTATADATAGGLGGSQGNVHNDVREDIRDADAKALAATLNRDLVRPLIDLNRGPPKDGLYPRIRIGQAEQFTKDDLDILTGLVELGVEIEASLVRDRAGYPDPPEKGKDGKPVKLLKAPASAAPGATPQNPAQDGQGGAPGTGQAKLSASGSERALAGPYGGLSSGGSPYTPDAIDHLGDWAADHWGPALQPMLSPIETAFAQATSYDDLKKRMLGLPAAMRVEAMAMLQTRAQMMARLAGEAGIDISAGGS